ncbi:hypothetical protein ACSBPQ_03785 [Stenotrophomonas sp. JC08]|uniref:hypothetical protein n=1 Tax=Stenotrophomonas sp. JC08 TaxID=3445779 RepID=UPI003FA1B373
MPPITTVTSGHCTSVPAPTFSASVRRASNLPPRSKTQGDLGLVETSRGAAAERVLDIETGTQWGAERRRIALSKQSLGTHTEQAKIGMGPGDAQRRRRAQVSGLAQQEMAPMLVCTAQS